MGAQSSKGEEKVLCCRTNKHPESECSELTDLINHLNSSSNSKTHTPTCFRKRYLVTLRSGASDLASLKLGFLICKTGAMTCFENEMRWYQLRLLLSHVTEAQSEEAKQKERLSISQSNVSQKRARGWAWGNTETKGSNAIRMLSPFLVTISSDTPAAPLLTTLKPTGQHRTTNGPQSYIPQQTQAKRHTNWLVQVLTPKKDLRLAQLMSRAYI